MAFKSGNLTRDLKGGLYSEEPLFNMTAIYYTILGDVIKATIISSLNKDTEGFINSMRDLLDLSFPILVKSKISISRLQEGIEEGEKKMRSLNSCSNAKQKEFIQKQIYEKLRHVRREILMQISPVLLATQKKLNTESRIDRALGL